MTAVYDWPIITQGGAGSDSHYLLCDAESCPSPWRLICESFSDLADLAEAVAAHIKEHHP